MDAINMTSIASDNMDTTQKKKRLTQRYTRQNNTVIFISMTLRSLNISVQH